MLFIGIILAFVFGILFLIVANLALAVIMGYLFLLVFGILLLLWLAFDKVISLSFSLIFPTKKGGKTYFIQSGRSLLSFPLIGVWVSLVMVLVFYYILYIPSTSSEYICGIIIGPYTQPIYFYLERKSEKKRFKRDNW